MKPFLTIALLLTLIAPGFAVPASTTADEAAIRKTTEGFFAAWNQGDIKDLVSHWTADATIINPDGRRAHGRAELEKLFTEAHAGAKGSTETLVSLSARFLRSDLAWVDVDLTVDPGRGPDGVAMPQVRYHLVGLVQKVGERWLWSEGRPYPLVPSSAGGRSQ